MTIDDKDAYGTWMARPSGSRLDSVMIQAPISRKAANRVISRICPESWMLMIKRHLDNSSGSSLIIDDYCESSCWIVVLRTVGGPKIPMSYFLHEDHWMYFFRVSCPTNMGIHRNLRISSNEAYLRRINSRTRSKLATEKSHYSRTLGSRISKSHSSALCMGFKLYTIQRSINFSLREMTWWFGLRSKA